MPRPILRPRRGATLPIMVGTLAVMIGFAGVGVDMAYLYVRKQTHVNAVDAAVLGAAMEMPDQAAAAERAQQLARANGLDPSVTVTVSFPSDGEIQVESHEDAPLYFARIFGTDTTPVSARAGSAQGIANKIEHNDPTGVRPLGVDWYAVPEHPDYNTPDTQVVLRLGVRDSAGNVVTPGNVFPLQLDPDAHGETGYQNMLWDGALGDFWTSLGVPLMPGDMTAVTQEVVQSLLTDATGEPWASQTPETATVHNPRVMILPVVEWDLAGNGRTTTAITKFVPFWIDGINGSELTGRFLYALTVPNARYEHVPGYPVFDGGVRTLRLLK
jgi:hypothetical protein